MVTISLTSKELDGNFKELLDGAITRVSRKEIDILMDKKLKEMIESRITDSHVENIINSTIDIYIKKHCDDILWKRSERHNGYWYPYEFNDDYKKLIVDKVINMIKVSDLEKAVKQAIKEKIMKGV